MTTHRPSDAEEEYFARQEIDRRRALALEREQRKDREERERLSTAHTLDCPHCSQALELTTMYGVLVHRCHACGGSWLNADALEQLAAKNAGALRMIAEGGAAR